MKLIHPDRPGHVIDVEPGRVPMYRSQGWVQPTAKRKPRATPPTPATDQKEPTTDVELES